ncbi:MAG: tetrahydrofolate dehydrogenase/cyclohydrolase catalytic domain-containing protein [Sideroxydans sp.]|nr:tetrahydrofolate dehydrogenase/cyclohydrolase catalytic domain-containing protein [Sideroxydans sp.]
MPITFPTLGPWYSTEEAAKIMELSPGHISRQCRLGKLECKQIGDSYCLSERVVKRLPDNEFNPADMANYFLQQLPRIVKRNNYPHKPRILGILAPVAGDAASVVYARTLQKACEVVGLELGLVENDLDDIGQQILKANADPSVHGIFIFFPIFKDERDRQLKDLIDPSKDIEGLTSFWSSKLYANERYVDEAKKKKAILPCTSLAVLKTLAYVDNLDERMGKTFKGKKITIFNRSDVVGLPLAYMLVNDGATVYSFDIDGGFVMHKNGTKEAISREDALKQSDMVITGVPSRAFEKIRGEEIKENVTCLNFSFVQNYEDSAKKKAGVYVPRVGPMTIAMCVRNAIRLYENNKAVYERSENFNPEFSWTTYGKPVDELAA